MTNDQWNRSVDLWNGGAAVQDIARVIGIELSAMRPFMNAIFDYVGKDRTVKPPFTLPESFRKACVSEVRN